MGTERDGRDEPERPDLLQTRHLLPEQRPDGERPGERERPQPLAAVGVAAAVAQHQRPGGRGEQRQAGEGEQVEGAVEGAVDGLRRAGRQYSWRSVPST